MFAVADCDRSNGRGSDTIHGRSLRSQPRSFFDEKISPFTLHTQGAQRVQYVEAGILEREKDSFTYSAARRSKLDLDEFVIHS